MNNNTEFKDTFAHTQLGANQHLFGGDWDTTMRAANAIEDGDLRTLIEIGKQHPEAVELIERVVTVAAEYR